MPNHAIDIYSLALEGNEKVLRSLISSTLCIDEYETSSLIPAATKLASQGHIEAAERLRRLGSNSNFIAEGAAMGGYFEYAESLLKHGACIQYIAQGAAQGGYFNYIKQIQIQGARADFIAKGAAAGGHLNIVSQLLNADGTLIVPIAEYAAIVGNIAFTRELLQRYPGIIHIIAKGAAIGGFIEYAEELRLLGAHAPLIAEGAAIGDHHEYAEQLLQLHPDTSIIQSIARGAAFGGHSEWVKEIQLNHQANIFQIALGATIGGHLNFAENFRTKGVDTAWIVGGACAGYHLTTSKQQFNWLLSFKDKKVRRQYKNTLQHDNRIHKSTRKALPYIAAKVEAIYAYQDQYTISQKQALALVCTPNLMLWLVQCGYQLRKERYCQETQQTLPSLPPEIILKITSYLVNFSLTENEILDLSYRLKKHFLIIQLEYYTTPPSLLRRVFYSFLFKNITLPNQQEATEFCQAVKTSQTPAETMCLLHQHRIISRGAIPESNTQSHDENNAYVLSVKKAYTRLLH